MNNPHQARQARWRREWSIVTAGLMLLALALGCSSWTWRLDQTFHDSAQSWWRRPALDEVVIVAIDDKSLQAMGRWPWKRSVHAQILHTIAAAKPKVILLDLLLSEPDADPQQDRILAEAIEQAAPVVLPTAFAGGLVVGQELVPTPWLARHAVLGHADAELDLDGVMRWTYLRAGWGQASRAHLALAMMEAAHEPVHPRIAAQVSPAPPREALAEPSWLRDQRLPIRYIGPPGTMRTVSYSDVLRGDVPASAFTGRHVLIGATAIGLGDHHQTPVSHRDGPMASVEITAQVLQMLMTGEGLRVAPPLAVGLGASSLVLALMAACWQWSPRRSLVLSAALLVLIPLASMAGLVLGVWFPPGSLLMACVLVYPVWSWRRLEVTADFVSGELTELLQQAQEEQPWTSTPPDQGPAADHQEDTDYIEHQYTAIKAVAQRLQDARHLMSATLAGMSNAVIVTDRAGMVRHANAQALALLDAHEATPSVSQRLAHLSPRQAPDWAWLIDQVMVHGQTVGSEVVGVGGHHYLAGLTPLRQASQAIGGCVICLTDISDLKRAEGQRDELLAFIAHDIRSPQASMIALVQLLRMSKPVLTAEEAIDQVDHLARTTLNLCEELLHIMRAETHPLKQECLQLQDLINQAILETQAQAQARSITLRTQWPSDMSTAVDGDALLIRRALVNLINNAVKFGPEHSVVTIEWSWRAQYAVIAVTDKGPGIPPSDLARLFRRFERVESDASLRTAPGIGLGLVFIDSVATRHGGQVHVRSQPGQGSTFELWLPIKAVGSLPAAGPVDPGPAQPLDKPASNAR